MAFSRITAFAAIVATAVATADDTSSAGTNRNCASLAADGSCDAGWEAEEPLITAEHAGPRRGGALLQTTLGGKPHARDKEKKVEHSDAEKPVSLLRGGTMSQKFIEDWQLYIKCCMDCAEGGKEAGVCASECYAVLNVEPEPPTPDAVPPPSNDTNITVAPTPPPGPPWVTCCKRYTAECLACVMEVSVPEFCEDNSNLLVPGCVAVIQTELFEERKKNTKGDKGE